MAMRFPAALACSLLTLCAAPAQAADSYKCKDARGGIVNSNETCEKQGLMDAGPVRERLTTMPSVSPTGRPPAKEDKKRTEKDEKKP
jgi:hypothetical protein